MAVERWFKSQPFRYSLTPGSMTDLDNFLFETQVGFCGHYASALAAVMRSADVPARVVSGYLGGRQIAPITGSPYLELRQSDAHAWVEVWLEGSGWQQPLAAIMPSILHKSSGECSAFLFCSFLPLYFLTAYADTPSVDTKLA